MKSFRKWAFVLSIVASLCALAWNGPRAVSGQDGADGKKSETDDPRSRIEKGAKKLLEEGMKGGKAEDSILEPDAPDDEESEDPDLPPGMAGKIDKAAYLRLRADYVDLRRGRPHSLPFNPRERAIEKMKKQENEKKARRLLDGARFGAAAASALSADPEWRELGPKPIPNGQTSAASVPVSGRTISIAIHPTDPNTVYVGTAQGGLYKSTNGGTNWTPLFDFELETLAIGALAIDPVDSNIVYVGTGEPNQSADSFAGRGLYIIRNANSASPVLTGPFRLNGAGQDVFTGRSFGRIMVNPLDNNVVYVSTTSGSGGNPNTTPFGAPRRGLYRSTNAQSANPTFEQVQVTGVPTPNDRTMIDIQLDPVNPNVLLVTVIGVTGDGGIYRTANALAATPTFTRTHVIPDGTGFRAELTATHNPTAGTTFYAATGELNPGVCTGGNATRGGSVRRSTDGGVTWSATLNGSAGFCGGQCFYDIAIAVTPDNQTIHLGGAARSGTAGLCNIDVMKRSTNGGASFVRNDNTLHADSHALAVAPSNPNVVYTGNDGGIWRSTNNGTTWTSLNNSEFSATQFQSIALHPFDKFFTIGGTQDNGTNCLAADGVTWVNCRGGDGGYAQIDKNAPDTTNVTSYHTFFNQTNSQIGFERATTSAFAWSSLRGCSGTFSNNGIGCGNAVLFYAPMELGPGDPQTVYFGTDRLYRSTNRGDTMVLASQGPLVPVNATQGVVITAIGISPQDDNVRIVGLRNGQVFATTTGSATLTDVTGANFPAPNPADPARKSIGRAVIDPNNKFTAYVTFTSFGVPDGQHVFKTTNLNDPTPTWTPAGNGIPDVPVSALVIDPQDSNSLYAGTDIGVYHSSDGGANWEPFGTGLPRVAVFDAEINNVHRILRIATHGRGMYDADIQGAKLPVLRNGGVTLVAEGCAPGNGAVDGGEDVTVSFGVTNIGAGPTSNLTVTLLPTGGVTNPTSPVNYGAVEPGGAAREFSFTAAGSCGGQITLTFHLQDGDTDYGNFNVTLTLGQAPTFTEKFDAVVAPALPAGWTTANTGAAAAWVTSNATSSSAPNSAFGGGAATPSNNSLTSPTVAIPTPPVGINPGVRLTFSNSYNTESGFDGGVLEISINGGAFQDVVAAGGTFIEGGYNGVINATTDSVLAGRAAWTGNSAGFITTTVSLPPAAFGQNAQFRWRTAYDTGTHPNGGGLRIDSLSLYAVPYVCCEGACALVCPSDIEADNDAGECGAVVNYPMPTYTGNCGVVTTSHPSGSFFPVGTTTVTVTGTKLDGTTDTCTFDITVKDAEPPTVSAATVDKPSLWPANHQMVDVTVNYTAEDNCGVNCTLTVTSNEPVNGLGDGDTAPDWEVLDAHHVRLRAERSGKGTGRTYTITVTCTDAAGNTVARTATVRVPKSQGGN
ncbi:MAG TPA: HYR domain-containing protein [Pyrinomonadaceae bacterium]|nr:HYR domain-containing protein [Pyrinomonadaceae bacterium]